MNASEKEQCRRCGAEIPATSTDKLCPACLLSVALEPTGGLTQTISLAPGGPLSVHGPAEFPCEFGGYELLGLLGRGGMGTVYDAKDLASGRRVALKMLGRQLDSPEMRQRFLREGRLAARVNHPNSLFVFGSEEVEGQPVITMEVAGGGTLKDKLKQRGPLPVAEAVDAMLDVIDGLESALAEGVLHRDIKPSNCFVCPDGSVKVGDFGLSVSTLAKTDTLVTEHGRIMGTPAYASPEQLRGDALDVRSDIYSVGATLFTLLTDRAPFEGDNAVQVVANAVNQEPKSVSALRKDVPAELAKVVARCLAKEPEGRYADYGALRDALVVFGSREPEAAPMTVRASAGWVDYLLAFLPPYVVLMFVVGGNELLGRALVERTVYSARYYFLMLGIGFAYFAVVEGVWGAGLGKWLKGLRVVDKDGRAPGVGRALVRIVIPILLCEGVRIPLTMSFISTSQWTGPQTAGYVIAAVVCGWIPAVFVFFARKENGFAAVWDSITGTRVVVRQKGTRRPSLGPKEEVEPVEDGADLIGPYQVVEAVAEGEWVVAVDAVLRRRVWLLRRKGVGLSDARRNVTRVGRLRWLQAVESDGVTWDAFEATAGAPFSKLVSGGKRVEWGTLRYWLCDLASELWEASSDGTMPEELSVDHVWITSDGRAVVMDEPWPGADGSAERFGVGDMAGQQRFLAAVADSVEQVSLPLHARGVLRNLADGRFEKLSFLAGTLRGMLDRAAEVSRGIRAGSIFMVPAYTWVAVFVGYYHDKEWNSPGLVVMASAVMVLAVFAVVQLLAIPLKSDIGQAAFRLAVVDGEGQRCSGSRMLLRWAIVWLPLLVPMSMAAWLIGRAENVAFYSAVVLLVIWLGAAMYAVFNPHRGLHDRLAGTWVVRR